MCAELENEKFIVYIFGYKFMYGGEGGRDPGRERERWRVMKPNESKSAKDTLCR